MIYLERESQGKGGEFEISRCYNFLGQFEDLKQDLGVDV